MKLQLGSKIIFELILPSICVDLPLKDDPDVSSLDLRLDIRLDIPFFHIFPDNDHVYGRESMVCDLLYDHFHRYICGVL